MYVDVVTILENSKMANVGILGITLKRNKSVDKNALVCSLFRTIELKKLFNKIIMSDAEYIELLLSQ